MDFNTEDEAVAKAAVNMGHKIKSKMFDKISKHQLKLTVVQYAVTILLFILGIIIYFCFSSFNLEIASLCINNINIHNLHINIGTILVLVSLYMFMKITLNLNINIYKGDA